MDFYNENDYESDSNGGISINIDSSRRSSGINRSESLFFILNEINYDRITNRSGYAGSSSRREFWLHLFNNSVLKSAETNGKDDLLFFVQQSKDRSSTEVKVFRRNSPRLGEMELSQFVEWEETVYLNLIMQQFTYILTVATVTRTGAQEYQILHKVSEKVYASPTKRQMESKGTEETPAYPNIYFTVDNFEDVFSECTVRDSESVCVELTAYDHAGSLQGVIFLGTVRYSTIKTVYDARNTNLNRLARHTASWFRSPGMRPLEFVRMLGPEGKGHSQIAICPIREPGVSVAATAVSGYGDRRFGPGGGMARFVNGSESQLDCVGLYRGQEEIGTMTTSFTESNSKFGFSQDQRRTSAVGGNCGLDNQENIGYDNQNSGTQRPSSSRVANLVAGGRLVRNVLHTKLKKSQSDGGTFDTMVTADNTGCLASGGPDSEQVDTAIYCEDFEEYSQVAGSWGQSFNQAWYWFKERRKASSPALSAAVTYVCLPWHRIVADILDNKAKPILTFDRVTISQ